MLQVMSMSDPIASCLGCMQTVGYGTNDGIDGYGEPNLLGTRVFTIFYSLIGIVVVLGRLSSLLSSIQKSTHAKLNALADEDEERLKQEAEAAELKYGALSAEGFARHGLEVVEEPMPAWKFYFRQSTVYGCGVLSWLLFSAWMFSSTSPGLSFLDGFYFSWITATTIGYGDSELSTRSSRIFCCVFILVSTAILTLVSGAITAENAARAWAQRRWRINMQSRGDASLLDSELLDRLHACARVDRETGLRTHDELSFLIAMLDHLGLVPRLDSKLVLQYFAHLDTDRSGSLSMSELWHEHRRVAHQAEGKP